MSEHKHEWWMMGDQFVFRCMGDRGCGEEVELDLILVDRDTVAALERQVKELREAGDTLDAYLNSVITWALKDFSPLEIQRMRVARFDWLRAKQATKEGE